MTGNINEEDSFNYSKTAERALFLSSIGTAFAVCFLFLNVVLSLTLMQLSSKYRVIPVLVSNRTRNSNEIVTREMFDVKMASLKAITEVYVRKYVEVKYNFCKDEGYMTFAWGPGGVFYFLSSPYDYKKFYVNSKVFDRKIKAMMVDYHSKRVDIKSLIMNESTNAWNVEFVINSLPSVSPSILTDLEVRDDILNLSVRYTRSGRRISGAFINPLGIQVR